LGARRAAAAAAAAAAASIVALWREMETGVETATTGIAVPRRRRKDVLRG
jgi:hypothetical protein